MLFSCSNDNNEIVRPESVINFTATPDNGKVILNWDTSNNTNIKNYSLSYGPEGNLINVENVPVIIENLINGVEYTFSLKARDMNNALSLPVSITSTPFAPDAPVLPFVGNVTLTTQAQVNSWNSNYTYIVGNLTIDGADINDLAIFQELDSIEGKFKIQNTELANLNGLQNLKKVTNSFVLWGNNSLIDNSALENLTDLGADLSILNNAIMPNLDGFSSLNTVGTHMYIGVKGWLTPPPSGPNPALSSFCGLSNLATNGTIGGNVFISNNFINPTISDIANGNCQ